MGRTPLCRNIAERFPQPRADDYLFLYDSYYLYGVAFQRNQIYAGVAFQREVSAEESMKVWCFSGRFRAGVAFQRGRLRISTGRLCKSLRGLAGDGFGRNGGLTGAYFQPAHRRSHVEGGPAQLEFCDLA